MTGPTEKRTASQAPFSLPIVLAAVVVGIVTFAAFIVLSAFADDLRNPEDGGEHALSKSAVGFAGLVAMLENDHRDVRINRGPLRELQDGEALVVLTPPPGREIEVENLYNFWGQALIILPKWQTRRVGDRSDWVSENGPLPEDAVEQLLVRVLDTEFDVKHATGPTTRALVDPDSGGAIPVGDIRYLQTISGDTLTPLLTDGAGRTVLGRIDNPDGDDPIGYILADPDLLNTQGLASLETARAGLAALNRISPEGQKFVFDMTLHGVERTRNVLQLLLTPPFLSATLCLVFAGLLVAIAAFAGNLRARSAREIPLGKTTLVDNSALLISIAGRSAGIGMRYAAMIRRQAVIAVGVPAGSSEAQQIAMLDTIARSRSGGAGVTFSELLAEASRASKPAAMLKAIIRLYQWKQELGRERKRR